MDRYRHLHPWRGANLYDALADLQWKIEELGEDDPRLPCLPVRRTPDAIAAREAEIGREIPAELKELFSVVDGDYQYYTASVCLWPLGWIRWLDFEGEDRDVPVLSWLHEMDDPWSQADYFMFGQTAMGDGLTYCLNSPRQNEGMVVILDSAEQGPDNNPDQPGVINVVADCLADWIARLIAFDLDEPAFAMGGIDGLPEGPRLAFVTDHLRLNPGDSYLIEKLASLE